MEQFLNIQYKLSKSENFDEYMKALGVGLVTRKMGTAMTPVVSLSLKDGTYTLTTSTTFKNQVPNEEFEEETLDGRKVKSIVKFDGNKMIQTQKDSVGKVISIIEREFSKNTMTTVLTAGDVVSTRVYERVGN
ncbi:fatty acid-binding protein, putative [Pediculus humanus corporis]|uniref:Fatty acid-binding protein, putative n=1 Tax=Pediculus humanus subsp. corporis TaxID=121224 RepID=E0VJ82_PEDHC|nr:fatty acid-binding protein, putative [Pediculus humanus corporis]EEB13438.1 fatty acid-binding protein, putative [Pediculus humanus corporis]